MQAAPLSTASERGDRSVAMLWRYPVKSMMGEELNAAAVTERGLIGDRRFAVVDAATGKVAGAKNPRKLVSGPGQYDGIEVLSDGRILVSSWADSAVHVITNGVMSKAITGVSAPTDIGIDTKRMLIAIPRFNDGKVEYYMIH